MSDTSVAERPGPGSAPAGTQAPQIAPTVLGARGLLAASFRTPPPEAVAAPPAPNPPADAVAPPTPEANAPAPESATQVVPSEIPPTPEPSGVQAPPESEAAPSPPPTPARPPLPDELREQVEALQQKDPSLRRVAARIWGDPNLTEIAKIQKISGKIQEAQAATPPPSPAAQREQLARAGNLQELQRVTLAEAGEAAQQRRGYEIAAQVIADAMELDPEDPAYLSASDAKALAAVVKANSPLFQGSIADALKERDASHAAALAAQKAEFEQQIAELNKSWQDKVTAARNEATAQADAGRPAPPRILGEGVLPPSGPNQIPQDRSAQVLNTRSLIASGLKQSARMREGAA